MPILRLATLVCILLASNKVRCTAHGDNAEQDSTSISYLTEHRDWPAIFGNVFESVSSRNLGEINMILGRQMEYVRKEIRPRCSLKFHTSQGVRDLSNKDCLIDETFIRLMIFSSKLRCSDIECLNPGSSVWDPQEIATLRGRMLMWLDIAIIEHGKEMSLNDRHFIANAILDDIYGFTKANNIKGLEKYLRETRLPSLQQMDQVKAMCEPDANWENDLACSWKNVLNEIFTLTKTYYARYAKVKQISTLIDYNKKLELQNLKNVVEAAAIKTRQNLEQFSDEIVTMINDDFDQLGDYFATLASYDADIAEADMGYIEGALAKFKRKEGYLSNELIKISREISLETQGAAILDSISAWMKVVATTIAACFDPSGAMDIWDKVDEAAASTANTIRATTLPELMADVKSRLMKVHSAFDKNRGLLLDTMDIVTYEENLEVGDTGDIDVVRRRFLEAYQDYDPQVSPDDISGLEQAWTNVLDVIRDSLGDMTQSAASAVKGHIFASNKIEEMARLIPEITALLESRYDYQFDLMDTLAVSLRAKLAKDSVQKLSDSIQTMRDTTQSTKLGRKQAALDSLITSRMHTIQAVQLHCNSLEYRNAGEMPSVCIDALQSLSDSAISDVIAYLPQACVDNTQNGVYVSIPASNTTRKGAINIEDLYKGKKTTFQIPESQWLVDNGWVRKSEAEESVFYVKGFQLFLVSLGESSKGRHLGVDISAQSSGPLLKDGKQHSKFNIQPTQEYRFSYKENIPPCDKEQNNPYELCETLSDMCIAHDGLLGHKYDMYPSIFSEWEIEATDLDEKIEAPKFLENELFLQAKVTLCTKTPSIKPNIIVREKPPQTQRFRTRCKFGQYFDRKTNLWKQCPTGSNASLGGYYCLPGSFIIT